MKHRYCSRCCGETLHDYDLCTKCGKTKGSVVSSEIPVRCPCCGASFYYQASHPIHNRHQTEIFPVISRDIHPEVPDEEEP